MGLKYLSSFPGPSTCYLKSDSKRALGKTSTEVSLQTQGTEGWRVDLGGQIMGIPRSLGTEKGR